MFCPWRFWKAQSFLKMKLIHRLLQNVSPRSSYFLHKSLAPSLCCTCAHSTFQLSLRFRDCKELADRNDWVQIFNGTWNVRCHQYFSATPFFFLSGSTEDPKHHGCQTKPKGQNKRLLIFATTISSSVELGQIDEWQCSSLNITYWH